MACGGESGAGQTSAGGGPGGARGAGGPGGSLPVTVRVTPAELGEIHRSITLSGTVEAIRTVAVNSRISGEILALSAEEGDRVREGQALARIDVRELQAELRSAEAAFEVARDAFGRAEQLLAGQVITQAEYDQERTNYAETKARLEQLRTQAEYAYIRSPMNGVVTEKRVEAGDIVGAQTHLFTVADLSTMVVRVPVSELDVVHVAPGDEAEVVLDALPGRALAGRVRRIFPTANPTTRLVPVEVELRGEGVRFARPGFLARVRLRLDSRENVVLVPASAVVGGQDDEVVYVVEHGKAYRRPIASGVTWQGRVEVTVELAAGEMVVVSGHTGLSDGVDVRVVDRPAGAVETRG